MNECEHVWEFTDNYKPDMRGYGRYGFICLKKECGAALTLIEAKAMLNEHAALKRGIFELRSFIDQQMGDSDLDHIEDTSIEMQIMKRLDALLTA